MMIRLLSTLALGAAITVPHVAAVNTCPTALPTTFTTQYITYETRSVPASSLPTTIPPTEQVHEMNGMEGTEPEEVTTTESPTEIPTDATTTTPPNEGTTEVPTDVPTEVPTSPPTEQVMVDIQVPILHTSPFTPKMILFNPNPQYKTLFTRDTSGHLYYTSNITNSTSGFIGIPPCPSSRDDPQPIYPEPAWDVHHLTNRLVYTCMESKQEEVTVPSTLNIYDVTTRRIKSFNLTEYCDLFKPTSITIDQKKKFDHIYITCTSPAPTSCTNIWRLSRHGSFTQVVDALECPNPRDVRVTGGRIIASCYDPDVINEQTGVRGYGWVTKIDNEQIQPITSSACMNPSQIYYMGQDVYTRCAADGTILRIDPDFLDWEENVFRNTTVFNSSKHCPPSTSLTSFHINSGLNTLYATCTDIRLTNPTTNPKFINGVTTTIVRSRLTNIDDGRKIIQNNEIRTFPLGSTCVPIHQSTNYNIAQDKTDKQDNVDQSSDGVLFVICRSPDSRDPQSGGIITLYHDPVRTIPMKVGTSGQSIHVGNSISGRGNGESSGITPADVMVPSSSSSSSSQVMGMSVGAGVSVIIFAIIVPLITLMIVIAIYMRRRKSNVRSINHRMEPAITPNPALAVAVDAQV